MYIQFYLQRHLYDSALRYAYITAAPVCSGTSWSDLTLQNYAEESKLKELFPIEVSTA